ncbi:glycosyltransferase [Flexivirga meconopsidis]|uniref:glycosyltransferase n=1 Tax=Flexivirga meconopsidis TaxID=2977121 RepID=UPI00223F1D00|nr:glycosyltransferase family 2 protein [Flexivirga meconopsidis]
MSLPGGVTHRLANVALCGGFALAVFGITKLLFVPTALGYEAVRAARLRRRRVRSGAADYSLLERNPLVSIIVPSYNEEPVLGNCVRAILGGDYENLEIILVDDGSTDRTADIAAELAAQHPRVRAISQANAGKGAALNAGIAASAGDVLMFVDADGIFATDTVRRMLAAFVSPTVGAVCGDDRPVNLDRTQTHLLAILNHAGTGMVRRALHLMGCLPIVSGNIGAFPRHVIEEVGTFNTETIGEDLELTWRVHRGGYRVAFEPRAVVYAEAPSTIRNLWRQRVRWSRGLFQTMRIHRSMIGNPRYGTFGPYLVVNTLTMIVAPLVQLVVLACLPFAVADGTTARLSLTTWALIGWLGLTTSIAVVVLSTALNGSLRDLRFAWTLLLWPLYSTGMALVVVTGLWQELRGQQASWNKMTRTGVVSATAVRTLADGAAVPGATAGAAAGTAPRADERVAPPNVRHERTARFVRSRGRRNRHLALGMTFAVAATVALSGTAWAAMIGLAGADPLPSRSATAQNGVTIKSVDVLPDGPVSFWDTVVVSFDLDVRGSGTVSWPSWLHLQEGRRTVTDASGSPAADLTVSSGRLRVSTTGPARLRTRVNLVGSVDGAAGPVGNTRMVFTGANAVSTPIRVVRGEATDRTRTVLSGGWTDPAVQDRTAASGSLQWNLQSATGQALHATVRSAPGHRIDCASVRFDVGVPVGRYAVLGSTQPLSGSTATLSCGSAGLVLSSSATAGKVVRATFASTPTRRQSSYRISASEPGRPQALTAQARVGRFAVPATAGDPEQMSGSIAHQSDRTGGGASSLMVLGGMIAMTGAGSAYLRVRRFTAARRTG